jgi:hypothetical protein
MQETGWSAIMRHLKERTNAKAEGKGGEASKEPAVQNVCLSTACFCGQGLGQAKPLQHACLPARNTGDLTQAPDNTL